MSFRKISIALFFCIFLVSTTKLFVMIRINEISVDIVKLNEDIKFYENEIEELEVLHYNLYSPQRMFELAKEFNFIRVERRIEKDDLLRPYDMSKVEEINPEILGFKK